MCIASAPNVDNVVAGRPSMPQVRALTHRKWRFAPLVWHLDGLKARRRTNTGVK